MRRVASEIPDAPRDISVFYVDDNPDVIEALHALVSRDKTYRWAGSLTNADELAAVARARRPDIVLLDVDMPGSDPFQAIRDLAAEIPETRVIMLSGHVHKDLVNRAIKAGAWGYVAKSDGERAMLDAIAEVAAGEFAMTAEVRSGYSL